MLKPLSEIISLKGKRTLINGAVVGIGRVIAYCFAEAGAELEVVDINIKGLSTLREELSHFRKEISIHRVHFSKNSDIGVRNDLSSYFHGALIAVDGGFLPS